MQHLWPLAAEACCWMKRALLTCCLASSLRPSMRPPMTSAVCATKPCAGVGQGVTTGDLHVNALCHGA